MSYKTSVARITSYWFPIAFCGATSPQFNRKVENNGPSFRGDDDDDDDDDDEPDVKCRSQFLWHKSSTSSSLSENSSAVAVSLERGLGDGTYNSYCGEGGIVTQTSSSSSSPDGSQSE